MTANHKNTTMNLDILGTPIFGALIFWNEITSKLNKVKGRHFVYLLINDNKGVVYVGMSFNLCSRLYYHKYRKEFHKIYILEYETIYKCRDAEHNLIKYYNPLHNGYK